MNNKDYYKILGVSKQATNTEIRKAYHKLAHKYHPDKGGDEQKFKEINEAYQILSSNEKRAQYDKFGRVFERGSQPGFDFQWSWGGQNTGFDFNIEDLSDLVEEMFGFRGGQRKQDLKRGSNIKIDLEVSLAETLQGIEKEITLSKQTTCLRCQGIGAEPGTKVVECFSCRGTGHVQEVKKTFFTSFTRYIVCPECAGEGYRPEKPCNVCKGEGRMKGKEDIKVWIPAGIDTNQIIRLEGKGNTGRRNGKPGDLFIRVFVKEDAVFQRKGDDLHVSIPILFSQAVLGDEIDIPTLEDKNILLKVPAGTESGKVFRISKKGIPHFSGRGRGDLYVRLAIQTPKKITKKQRELLKKLRVEEI